MGKCLYYQRGTQSLTLLLWYSVKEQLLSMDTWIPKNTNERHFTLFKLVINLRLYKKSLQAHLIMLHLTLLCFKGTSFLFFFCPKWFLATLSWASLLASFSIFFPKASAHFMSLCHILIVLTIFQMFLLLLYLL